MSSPRSVVLKGSQQAMPLVGLGTWKIAANDCATRVYEAIQAGYRLLDCACDYGNEQQVGEGLKRAIAEGIVKREEVFVTSKLWNTFHARENVRAACEKTLADLGLDYIDLYLIHFPISLKHVPIETRYPPEWIYDPAKDGDKLTFEDVTIRETWEAMEELHAAGLAKNIGVANFNCSLLMDVLKYAKVKPAVNQVELHPYLQQPKLVEFCHRFDIAMTAYSSFGGQSYVELNFDSAINNPSLLQHDTITKLGKKHGKSPAQVLLRWAVQQNIAVIPKTSNPKRLAENADLFEFKLDDSDLQAIKALQCYLRFNDPGAYFNWPIFD